MKLIRLGLVLFPLLLLLVAASVSAQTVTQTLSWDQPNDTLTDIQGYVFTYTYTSPQGVGNGAPIPLKATCAVPTAGVVACTAPITPVLLPGTVLTLTATDVSGAASSAPYTYQPGVPSPSNPTGVVVTVTVTVP